MVQFDHKSSHLSRRFYLNKVLDQWASRPATLTTLRQLIFFGRTLLARRDEGKLLASANYVREELPVRIAHRIRDLQGLPYAVMTNPHMESVYAKYWSAFDRLRKFSRIRTHEDNDKFCALLRSLLQDHLTVIPSLTIGIVESSDHLSAVQLDDFMQRMLRSRISRRVLAEQHIALSEALEDPSHVSIANNSHRQELDHKNSPSASPFLTASLESGSQIGIIYTRLSIAAVIFKVIRLLREVFASEKGIHPDDPYIPQVTVDGDLGARFAYIPEHLEWIIFQLVSNAMRSTMNRPIETRDPVPIRVTVVEGPADEDIIIRFSDSGGGLPDVTKDLASPRWSESSNAASFDSSATLAAEGGIVFHDPEVRRQAKLASSSHPLRKAASDAAPQSFARPLADGPTGPSSSGMSSLNSTSGSRDDLARLHPASVSANRPPAPDFAFGDDGSPLMTHSRTPFISSSAAGFTSYLSRGDAEERDLLIRYLCSFSNVRKRLQIEAERKWLRRDQQTAGGVSGAAAGLGSQQQLDALRAKGVFRGSIEEQLHDGAGREPPSSLPSYTPGPKLPVRETGLGLPMTKVYCDFFGGSIAFRSLEGHSMDVYVRLPKLGTKKERIEEIVL